MIQNQQSTELYKDEQDELTKEISQFRRINASLKKKIQARDKKISYLFSCVDQMSKSSLKKTIDTGVIKKNRSDLITQLPLKKEGALTEAKNKEKQNQSYLQFNIFKDKNEVGDHEKVNFRLPALDRKNIFAQNPETSESRPKIIKISIQKLIPLKPEDVKKKFQDRFK